MTKGFRPQSDRCWVPFRPDTNVPAFAVMEGTGATIVGGQVVITTRQYQSGSTDDLLLVNGPVAVNAGEIGMGSTAEGYPMPVLADSEASANDAIGPYSGAWSCATNGTAYEVWGDGAVGGTVLASRKRQTKLECAMGHDCRLVHSTNTSNTTFTDGELVYWSPLASTGSGGNILVYQSSKYQQRCAVIRAAGTYKFTLGGIFSVTSIDSNNWVDDPAFATTAADGHTHDYKITQTDVAASVLTTTLYTKGESQGDAFWESKLLAREVKRKWEENTSHSGTFSVSRIEAYSSSFLTAYDSVQVRVSTRVHSIDGDGGEFYVASSGITAPFFMIERVA